MKKNTGFTLIELLITIAIISVLLVVGMPSLKNFMQGSQLVASTNELVTAFNVARSEAIKRNGSVTVCESTNGTTCSAGTGDWQDGWIVFVSATAPILTSSGVACSAGNINSNCLLRSHAAFADDQLTVSGVDSANSSTVINSVTFNARGLPRSAGGIAQASNFSVCSLDDAGSTQDSRAVVLGFTGRARVSDNAAVITCP
jgi:type IV fimbrial biogenesis protein FimT